MNRQRQVIVTVTYNDLGVIVDTKAEKLDSSAQPNLQPTCNQLATDTISRRAAIDALKRLQKDISGDYTELDPMVMAGCGYIGDCIGEIQDLPSAQPEWNNHTVACLLAELFDDTCACNYNGIDEWLPSKCELLDSCQNPVGVACWEQYLKHRAERRTNEVQNE